MNKDSPITSDSSASSSDAEDIYSTPKFNAFTLLQDNGPSSEEEPLIEQGEKSTKEPSIKNCITKKSKKKPATKTKDTKTIQPEVFSDIFSELENDSLDSLAEAKDVFQEAFDPQWIDPAVELKHKFKNSDKKGKCNNWNGRIIDRAMMRKWRPFVPESVGLSLVKIKETEDYNCWKFVTSDPEYHAFLEDELFVMIRSHDIQGILHEALKERPHSPDVLLTLAQATARFGTEVLPGMSALDLFQRVIYILERLIFLPINPAKPINPFKNSPNSSWFSGYFGKSRMPYVEPENRRFHLALFGYVQCLIKQACWRTARNVALLLLSLDPEVDPLGIRIILEFLGVQCGSINDRPFWHPKTSKFSTALYHAIHKTHTDPCTILEEAIKEEPNIAHEIYVLIKNVDGDKLQDLVGRLYAKRMALLLKQPFNASMFTQACHKCSEAISNKETISENANLVGMSADNVAYYRHALLFDDKIPMPLEANYVPLDAHDPLPPEYFSGEDAVGLGHEGILTSLMRRLTDMSPFRRH